MLFGTPRLSALRLLKPQIFQLYSFYSGISIGFFRGRPPSGNFRGFHFEGFPDTHDEVDSGFELQISARGVWENNLFFYFFIFFARNIGSEFSDFGKSPHYAFKIKMLLMLVPE